MNFNTPTKTVLYSIEETIKAYRKLSQHNIATIVSNITIDQALILMLINDSDKTQTEIADLVFKDYASMTRIINLMISKNYLTKTLDKIDKRKAKLKVTKKGKSIISKLSPMITLNRATALKNISRKEQQLLFEILNKITQNCKTAGDER